MITVKLAILVQELRKELEDNYKGNYAYTICADGNIIAAHNLKHGMVDPPIWMTEDGEFVASEQPVQNARPCHFEDGMVFILDENAYLMFAPLNDQVDTNLFLYDTAGLHSTPEKHGRIRQSLLLRRPLS